MFLAPGVAEDFAEAARQRGVEIRRVEAGATPITADAARVRQALANLLPHRAPRYARQAGSVGIGIDRTAEARSSASAMAPVSSESARRPELLGPRLRTSVAD